MSENIKTQTQNKTKSNYDFIAKKQSFWFYKINIQKAQHKSLKFTTGYRNKCSLSMSFIKFKNLNFYLKRKHQNSL